MKKPEGNAKGNTQGKKYMEAREYDVLRTKMFDNGGVTFDMELNGVRIYGCRVVEGKNGDFISFPQRKGSDGKYYSIAWANLSPDDQASILRTVERKLNGEN